MSLQAGLHVLTAAMFVVLAFTCTFFAKLYMRRMKFVKLRKLGLPMPPHSFLFGHIRVFGEIMAHCLPDDAHGHYFCRALRQAYPDLPPNFYVDLWPLGGQLLLVSDPNVAYQCTVEHSLPKALALKMIIEPFTGGKDLVTMEGNEWKTWRAIYNPGFAAGHLMTMVPGIVEDAQTFAEVLKNYALGGGLFKLEEVCNELTIDIIGRVVLDTRIDAQRSTNDLLAGFRSQAQWVRRPTEVNPFKICQPLRPLMQWYNTRRMNRWLSTEIDARFSSRKELDDVVKLKRSKPVIDIALDTYLSKCTNDQAKPISLDSTFKSFAITQVKLFMLAGHDTTASTLCYLYYLLYEHPSCRAKLIAELDAVFGTEVSKTADLIKSSPHLLNRLSYTTAALKETLRLFPPGSSLRVGNPNFTLSVPGFSTLFPTDVTIWIVHHAVHRSEEFWPSPDAFIPERFLVPEGDPLYPEKGAWRPFEVGPRNCIGQELAMLEMKIIMALTVREFEIIPGYEEFDRQSGIKGKTVFGERAYQSVRASAKPAQGMPVRVKMR